MSIYVVSPEKLIEVIAEKLKEFPEISPPKGSEFWKTAFFKELAPTDSENFWYIRCASLLRKVNKYGPIGVNKLRKFYGVDIGVAMWTTKVTCDLIISVHQHLNGAEAKPPEWHSGVLAELDDYEFISEPWFS